MIENLTTCDVRSAKRFLNAENFRPAEIHRLIAEASGDSAITGGNVRKQRRVFQEGRTHAHDEELSGRPSLFRKKT
jgi:hypothetical protein